MNSLIHNKAELYNKLPNEIQDKIDAIIHINSKIYLVNHICPLIQKKRIEFYIREIIFKYWLVFKFNLLERMNSQNRFFLNILEGDLLYFLNNKINVFSQIIPELRNLLQIIFDIEMNDYYDYQINTRSQDKYFRILIILRSLSFQKLEDFYFYCIFLRQ